MNENAKSWILQVVKDPNSDDLMLEFPVNLLKAANLKVGDTLEWSIEGAQVILQRIEKQMSTGES